VNALVLTIITIVVTWGYLVRTYDLPRQLILLPEALSGIVILLLIVLGVRSRFGFVRPGYWLAFGGLGATMVFGAVVNAVDSGAMIAGMRDYLRAVPLFFLPAVYAFSERQVRRQMAWILVLCLPQLPLAIFQRQRALSFGNPSGDDVSGTLLYSGLLSLFLISIVCVATAALVRRRISLWLFVPLFMLLVLPTAINETKMTIIVLPLALMAVCILGAPPRARMRNAALAMMLLAMFGALFVPIYDHFIVKQQYEVPIAEFFADKDRMGRYMGEGAQVGSARTAGRTDAILTPLREITATATHAAFGFGMGNASESALGERFSGHYWQKYKPFMRSGGSQYILELGLIGLIAVFCLFAMIFRDSRRVADADPGTIGTIALGWTGVTVVMLFGTFYVNLAQSEALAYLFWFFSGLIAAQRVRLASAA